VQVDGVRCSGYGEPLSRHLFRKLAHRLYAATKPRERTLFVVIRRRDGKGWLGPYKYRGETFTVDDRRWYRWGSRAAAESAVLWGGWTGVDVVEVSEPVASR